MSASLTRRHEDGVGSRSAREQRRGRHGHGPLPRRRRARRLGGPRAGQRRACAPPTQRPHPHGPGLVADSPRADSPRADSPRADSPRADSPRPGCTGGGAPQTHRPGGALAPPRLPPRRPTWTPEGGGRARPRAARHQRARQRARQPSHELAADSFHRLEPSSRPRSACEALGPPPCAPWLRGAAPSSASHSIPARLGSADARRGLLTICIFR